MRDRLECGVFYLKSLGPWLDEFVEQVRLKTDRLQLTKIDVRLFTQGDDFKMGNHSFPNPHIFKELSILFERYDCLILPVMPESLVWTRIMLAQLGNLPNFPMVLLAHDVQPIAFLDLSKLGIMDYIFENDHPTLMRLRISNVLERFRLYGRTALTDREGENIQEKRESLLKNLPIQLGKLGGEYSLRLGRQGGKEKGLEVDGKSPLKANSSMSMKSLYLSKAKRQDFINYSDTFQVAKSKMISEFEKNYVVNALRVSHGNIGMAAQFANKHRRAFWELMRKHQIQAEDYKDNGNADYKEAEL